MPAAESVLRACFEEGLAALGGSAEPPELDRWVSLALLLERWSQRINLTGHHGAVEIAERLLLEAAALERVLPEAEDLADLGSGAGIPGLPLAIRRPKTQVRLVEARERRHHFQRAAIRALALENVEALRGRAERLEAQRCPGVVSQALAQPSAALELMRRWVEPGGWVAIATVPELEPIEHPAIERSELRPYAAPAGPQRAVWIAWFATDAAPD